MGERLCASPSPLIDTHVHFYDPARPQGVPWPTKDDTLLYRTVLPDSFRTLTGPLGVTGVIVIEASPLLEDNQWVLDLARRTPLIAGTVGNLPCGTPEFRKHLDRFQKNRLFRGIRLGSGKISQGLTQPPFMNDLRQLAAAGLELDAIGGIPMLTNLLKVSDAIPELRIVIDHLPFDWGGSPRPALRLLGQRPHVYAKVSNVHPGSGSTAALDELWDSFGPDHLVYGSNWPVSDRVAPYDRVLRVVREYIAAKGAAAAAKFFWKNSKAAYGWEDR